MLSHKMASIHWYCTSLKQIWNQANRSLPNAMTAASRYRQSVFLMCSVTNGRTCGTMSSSQQVAISIRHTPAALQGFHSSSSSNSSYTWTSVIRVNITYQKKLSHNKQCITIRQHVNTHYVAWFAWTPTAHSIWITFYKNQQQFIHNLNKST